MYHYEILNVNLTVIHIIVVQTGLTLKNMKSSSHLWKQPVLSYWVVYQLTLEVGLSARAYSYMSWYSLWD